MRLFTAINFDDKIKAYLLKTQMALKEYAERVRFSGANNLHLTLVFLGETEAARVPAVCRAIDDSAVPGFTFSISDVGRFRRGGGDILWAGVENCEALRELQRRLSHNLKAAGFSIENREFKPHLTLAREAVMRAEFDPAALSVQTGAAVAHADRISLMKSERIGGRMVYTELYGKQLERV